MYITRVEIENIKCFKHLRWEIDAGEAPGWHVILGDNGSGKSTFLRCVALGIVDVPGARTFQPFWSNWFSVNRLIQAGKEPIVPSASIYGTSDSNLDEDSHSGFNVIVRWGTYDNISIGSWGGSSGSYPSGDTSDRAGWFAQSFGPFRRFTGSDSNIERAFKDFPRLYRHISLFLESVALSDSLEWLQNLRFKQLEKDSQSEILLHNIHSFINQPGLLPNNVRMSHITSDGVYFDLPDGNQSTVLELSDGYRSILSMAFELFRQLSIAYGPDIFQSNSEDKLTVKVPGVVLIDEVDTHLHPTWQKDIGFWLREHFPNIQFIVTTHSPLVCQAADKGTIFQLPKPGSDEPGRFIEGIERNRLLYGNILDAYSTEVFGSGITRSEASEKKLERLSELNVKEMYVRLTPEEEAEQAELRAMLPTSAASLSAK